MDDETEHLWLVGLLEGEVYFQPGYRTRNKTHYPGIQLEMVDGDLVRRAARTFDARVFLRAPVEEGWSYTHKFYTTGEDVRRWVFRWGGYFGSRRRQQIASAFGLEPLERSIPDTLVLHWMTGLLEGEGSFLVNADDNRPTVQLRMTDQEVVKRYATYLGISVQVVRQTRDNRQPIYVAVVRGASAVELMHHLAPRMSQRRQARIAEILDGYHPSRKSSSRLWKGWGWLWRRRDEEERG
jgi:hypothetical protein